MTLLQVGVIGIGMAFQKLHCPAYQELSNKYKIVALFDKDAEKAEYWANILQLGPESVYADFREMTGRDDTDIFDIMVPIPQNFEVTKEVARRIAGMGKGIISEKPTAASLEGAQAHRDIPSKKRLWKGERERKGWTGFFTSKIT